VVYLHAFLTSALDGGEWSVLRPGRFTPRERAPGIHWILGWVGLRAGLTTSSFTTILTFNAIPILMGRKSLRNLRMS
jgi:hypothetical protein